MSKQAIGTALAAAALLLISGHAFAQQAAAPPPAAAASGAPTGTSAAAPANVALTVDTGKKEQTIQGFGAAIAYYEGWVPANPYHDEIYNALFKDLKLDILRLRNDYDGDPKNKTFADDQSKIVAGATKALGHTPTILMTSWAPPKYLKSNGQINNGGTLIKNKDGSFDYDGFAQYWADSLADYREHGVVPTWISIQNEPDFVATWQSCIFKPVEETVKGVDYAGYDKALDAVYNKLQNGPDHPLFIGPECIGIGYGTPELFINSNNTVEEHELYAVAHHLYHGGTTGSPDTFIPAMNRVRDDYKGVLPVMETEYDRGDYFNTAWMIEDSLNEENVTAYLYWEDVWPAQTGLLVLDDPTRKANWRFPHGWQPSDAYYALKHFSRYTDPGDTRVDTTSTDAAVKITALLHPDKKRLTLILLNTSSTDPKDVTLQIDGWSPRSSEVYETAGTDRFKDLGALQNLGMTLPPRSIVTIVLRR